MFGSLSSGFVAFLAVAQSVQALPSASMLKRRQDMSIMDASPNLPYDPNTIATCGWWWDNDGSIPCQDLVAGFGISMEAFLKWNPSLTSSCGNFNTGRSYCVEAPSSGNDNPTTVTTVTTKAPGTTTAPGNGITTPQPTQSGMVTNCNRFHFVETGELCTDIASANGISQQQFVDWNKSVGPTCTGLWAKVNVCVGIIGMTTSTSKPVIKSTSTSKAGNGIATPTPTQPGMVSNCDKFHLVKSGETCASIGASNGITVKRISDWNTSVGSSCTGLWANVNVCVRTIGFTPSTSTTCHTASDHKTWGDNKPAALESVVKWCDGNSGTDGSGGFSTAQIKRGCYGTPLGSNKIEFVARNDFGSGAYLSVAKCEEIMKAAVNRCTRGGTGTHEGWWFSARVVSGSC